MPRFFHRSRKSFFHAKVADALEDQAQNAINKSYGGPGSLDLLTTVGSQQLGGQNRQSQTGDEGEDTAQRADFVPIRAVQTESGKHILNLRMNTYGGFSVYGRRLMTAPLL